MREIAALFVRKDSHYKAMPGVDCWDAERDARNWPGGCPIIAHPPCAQWGRLSNFAHSIPAQKALGPLAVKWVREWGGVLEHPSFSKLWAHENIPQPGKGCDEYGGYTLPISQKWFGHKAEKQTWLYIVGVAIKDLPVMAYSMAEPTHVVSRSRRKTLRLPEVSRRERELTPVDLAQWLVQVTRLSYV